MTSCRGKRLISSFLNCSFGVRPKQKAKQDAAKKMLIQIRKAAREPSKTLVAVDRNKLMKLPIGPAGIVTPRIIEENNALTLRTMAKPRL
jgi:hypothetical protein